MAHNKILYFSGIYPIINSKRGMPFIQKRFNIVKKCNFSDTIHTAVEIDKHFQISTTIESKEQYCKRLESIDWSPSFYKKSLTLKIFNHIYKKGIISQDPFSKHLKAIIKKDIDLHSYNLAHVHWAYPSGYIFSQLKREMGLKYVLTVHGSDIHKWPHVSENIKKSTVTALENAQKAIFVSNDLLKKAKELGYSGTNSTVIPNGFDPEVFYFEKRDNSKGKLNLPSKPLIGFVGNLINVKNVLVLPEIFKELKKSIDDLQFIIIGNGDLKSELENRCQEYELSVNFTGNIDQKDVANYMRAMDIILLPSLNEGWPCIIKEAQACGTYVVGSDRGGIPDAIGTGGKSFSLDDSFIQNCVNHCLEILKNKIDIDHLLSISKEFTWENIVKQEIEVYRNFLYS